MRQDVYDLFTNYEPTFQYKWNKIIAAGFDAFADELGKMAAVMGFNQSRERRYVFWRDVQGEPEALFAYIVEPTDLDRVIALYQEIRTERIPVTFAVIEQREDGEGQYDIFRLSEKSYLEHCNRAWAPGTSCDE